MLFGCFSLLDQNFIFVPLFETLRFHFHLKNLLILIVGVLTLPLSNAISTALGQQDQPFHISAPLNLHLDE